MRVWTIGIYVWSYSYDTIYYLVCVYGLLAYMFGHDVCVCAGCVLRVRTATVHKAVAQHNCVDRLLCACVMTRKHVTCATTTYSCRSIILFKVNNKELFESEKSNLKNDIYRFEFLPMSSVVCRASSSVARASFTLLPRLVAVLHKNRTDLETDVVRKGV